LVFLSFSHPQEYLPKTLQYQPIVAQPLFSLHWNCEELQKIILMLKDAYESYGASAL
jgi:hypothetical protein